MSFRPVRDPVTGRIDMIPEIQAEWGEYGRSESVRAVIGKERYDSLHPEDFDGTISDVEHLHDATIVEITSLLAPHADDEMLGKVARQWTDANRLVREGVLSMATVAFTANGIGDDGHEGRTLIVINVTLHESVLTMFCSCGDILYAPISYWSDKGAFATGEVEDDAIDHGMTDPQVQQRRWETTEIAIIASRKLKEQPAGVVDMAAFRALRAVRG